VDQHPQGRVKSLRSTLFSWVNQVPCTIFCSQFFIPVQFLNVFIFAFSTILSPKMVPVYIVGENEAKV